ncbi:hypothetical protein G6F37_010027 [Rhizopus arrhizus]|nr:hypothetical protein G6F38_001719 [Rhizopus arrhizus]KAG1153802.1 hypothetical protein G6F37_010027 [Rhizopus arrhizus]
MDLSWCIICDRHCADNKLYCSEACRFQDSTDYNDLKKPSMTNTLLITPPPSPEIKPFLYPVQDRIIPSDVVCHHFSYTPGSSFASSIYADDT